MGKAKKDKEYRFMVGVLDSKTHSNLFYAKNLGLGQLEDVVKELKKKYR